MNMSIMKKLNNDCSTCLYNLGHDCIKCMWKLKFPCNRYENKYEKNKTHEYTHMIVVYILLNQI